LEGGLGSGRCREPIDEAADATASGALGRLQRLIPPDRLEAILERLADRLEAAAQSDDTMAVHIVVHVHHGEYRKTTWTWDERIG
jgi:hypothetical protein